MTDDITPEARMIAAQARMAAEAGTPSAEELARIAAEALRKQREDMTPSDIRQLAVVALAASQRVSYLLGRLSGLLDDEGAQGV